MAAELGHTTVLLDGELCTCGNRGCLETVASGRGIAGRARRSIANGGMGSILRAARGDLDRVTAELVFEAARQGDHEAQELVGSAYEYLGVCLANLINVLDPQMIVLGGGVVEGGGLELLSAVTDVATARSRSEATRHCQIRTSGLTPYAGVIGCGRLFWREKA
jgi:glucokinase